MKLPNKASVVQFIKFGIVGLSNTIVSLAVYYVVLWINPAWYLLGNVAGWVVSVANAFFWNNKYVFGKSGVGWKSMLKKLSKSYLSYGSTFLLGTLLLYIEVDVWEFSAVLCPAINLLVTIPLNFVLNKFWTFR